MSMIDHHLSAIRSEPAETAPSVVPGVRRGWWWTMLVAAAVGVASGTITVVDKIALLTDPAASSFCDISPNVSCSPVLLAPQSSILGPPNALIGVVLYTVFLTAALAALMGGHFPSSFLRTLVGLAVFFGAFLTWYMFAVAFQIGSLCPFCTVCAASTLVIVLAANRLAVDSAAYGDGRFATTMATMRGASTDAVVVVGWGALIAAMLIAGIWVL